MKPDPGWTRVPKLTFLDVGGLASGHQQLICGTGHPPCDATVDSNGEIAVHVTPASAGYNKFTPGVDLIAVSRDGGKTWQKHPAPGERDWNADWNKGTPRWVEPVAWDADGALYSLWGSQKRSARPQHRAAACY